MFVRDGPANVANVFHFISRIEQPGVVHRFLPRVTKPESCGEVDTTTGETTSVHHGREVYEALVGKLVRVDRSLFISLNPLAATHTTYPSTLPSTLGHTCRSQATIWWIGAFTAKGNSGLPGCCFIQSTSRSAPSLYGPGNGPGKHFHQPEPLYHPIDRQRTTNISE